MPAYIEKSERVYWAPTIATPATPSVAELTTTGKKVSHVIRAIAGFTYTGTDVDSSDMETLFPTVVPGMFSAPASSITFRRGDSAGDPEKIVEALFTYGLNGYIVFSPIGTAVTSGKVESWPVRVQSNAPSKSADAALATFVVGFSVTGAPIAGTLA